MWPELPSQVDTIKYYCFTSSAAHHLRQHFFTERVISILNHLEASIVEAETLNTFKSGVRTSEDSR